ncbi:MULTISPECIES: hypothetical protein [unclassified Aureimonas]|uniref:hypothetical protein n=1 Tax=unclassified Aureimonas TaxID=2615206 RepID=UPI000AF75744|nr:hypothetical protein [Aureimonas sp. Leaf427]
MRQISWKEAGLLTGLLVVSLSAPARADDLVYLDRSDRGFNLPGVTLPQGQDEVHAADGTTCRSAVGGSGTYLDVGAIKDSLGQRGSDDVATYARVVIPLGARSSRLDCAKLYALEVERLQLELKLLKMGLSAETGGGAGASSPPSAAGRWAADGWSSEGIASPGAQSRPQPEATARPTAPKAPGAARQVAAREAPVPEEAPLGLY